MGVLLIAGFFYGDSHAQKIRLRSQIKPNCQVTPPYRPWEFFGDISASENVAVHGGYGCYGAFIYDISNPDAPVLAKWFRPHPKVHFHEIFVAGNRGYLGSSNGHGVYIVDLTDPYNPVTLGVVDPPHGNGFDRTHELIVSGNYLIENLHSGSNRITKIINVSNPANPVFITQIETPAEGGWTHAPHVRGNRLYISNFGAFNQPGRTYIYDISNVETQAPTLLGTIVENTGQDVNNDDWTHSSWTSEDGNFLYSCREKFPNPPSIEGGDVRVYNVSNPAQPVLVNRLTTKGLGLNAWAPHNPMVKGNYLYVGWYHAGLQMFDISNPANPVRVGQYDSYQPALAPTVEELRALTEINIREKMCGADTSLGGAQRGAGSGVANINILGGAWSAVPLSLDKIVIGDVFNGLLIVDASKVNAALENQVSDFDGDGKTDLSVYTPDEGIWSIEKSSNSTSSTTQLGLASDKIEAGDYDGDGKTDIAVFRPSNGTWIVLGTTRGFFTTQFGASGDIPVAADYDADGKTDFAVFRPSEGTWYLLQSVLGYQAERWGVSTDKPLVGDFEGDGKIDLAVFRPSNGTWYIRQSSSSLLLAAQFGADTDKPVSGDFDGDNKTDLAVYRPAEGNWYVWNSSNNSLSAQRFGIAADTPIPADYDGDGKTDIAVFRASDNAWYRLNSTNGAFVARSFGQNGAIPSPASIQP